MKGDVKNKLLPQQWQEMFLEIQPPLDIRGKALVPGRDRIGIDPDWEIAIRSISISASSAASLNASAGSSRLGLCWQPGFYLRLEAYSFMGLSETSEGFCQVNCGHEHHDCGSSFP